MPDFHDVGRKFRQRLRTVDGRHFYGLISMLPDTAGRGNAFYVPRRLLNVHPSCNIKPGEIILDTKGRVMLCAWAGDDETQGSFSSLFKLYDLDQQLTWTRSVGTNDPVTKLSKNSTSQNMGMIWGTLELLAQDLNNLGALSRYRLLCNADLHLNDRINGHYSVRRVEKTMGIVIALVA